MIDTLVSGQRVLVVEDEAFLAMHLEDLLADLGCEVVGPVARLAEALEIVAADGPLGAAVLDINLNGEDSYPVAHALTARKVPFFFCTGYEPHVLSADFRDVSVLQKPFETRHFTKELEKLMR